MAMAQTTPEVIWAGFPHAQRNALQATRRAIADAVPGAEQYIAWGMPSFRVGKDILISLTGFQKHNSLFPGKGVTALLQQELQGLVVTKGTIHFDRDHPFPKRLLKKILTSRIADINASYPRANGQVREYYGNGFLKMEGRIKQGERYGTWKWYRRDGSLWRVVTSHE